MPTIFSHAIFASAIGKAYVPETQQLRFWVLTATCAMLPDADAVGFAFGVRYGSMLGHRGLTHSIAFAVLVGLVVGTLAFEKEPTAIRRLKLVLYFALITLSHPLLDALTNGGLGVALFAPFSAVRYFFPWRPIEVSPIGMRFFSERGLEVLASEVIWVWLPALLIYTAAKLFRKRKTSEE
ncbi:MAG TPA: metal-dependent hydrolase [Pyrinomonadaceae bacterium]|jgi:inner membrane protein|nr:metal-dependent hydrolase [Pyrinomonadaceae bacterium]